MMGEILAATDRGWKYWREPEQVVVDGNTVAYRRSGTGPTVLYLHGAGMTRQWLPFHAQLAERTDLIAPEHPGYGDSPLPADFRDFSDYVLHYDAFLDQLGVGEVHLIGHSLGGRIAGHLATFYPRRFASLTLITPAGLRVEGAPLIDGFRMSGPDARSGLLNGRDADWTDLFELQGAPEDAVSAYQESTTTALLTWTDRFDRRLEQRLQRISAPTLVIGSEEYRMVATGTAARYAELIPRARLVTPVGPSGAPSGHILHIEQPEDVVPLVLEHVFAASTSPEGN